MVALTEPTTNAEKHLLPNAQALRERCRLVTDSEGRQGDSPCDSRALTGAATPAAVQSWLVLSPPLPELGPYVPLAGLPAHPCPVLPCPRSRGHCPLPLTRLGPVSRGSGLVHIKNPHLDSMEEDVLYHLDLGTKTRNLLAMFGDIKVNGGCEGEAAAPSPTGLSSPSSHSSASPGQGPAAVDAPARDRVLLTTL